MDTRDSRVILLETVAYVLQDSDSTVVRKVRTLSCIRIQRAVLNYLCSSGLLRCVDSIRSPPVYQQECVQLHPDVMLMSDRFYFQHLNFDQDVSYLFTVEERD
jgi:hypothetical protein